MIKSCKNCKNNYATVFTKKYTRVCIRIDCIKHPFPKEDKKDCWEAKQK